MLENFVSSLPNPQDGTHNSTYVVTSIGKEFRCEVLLPSNSPISGAIGQSASTKQVAKCSAAFEACIRLRKSGHLDAHFLSTFVKTRLAMQNAHLAVNSKKREKYDMRTKPSIWNLHTVPEKLFLTTLELSDDACLGRKSQPLGLLTRTRLPEFPEFLLHFGMGRKSATLCRQVLPVWTVNPQVLTKIDEFTRRIFQDVFSKEYQPDIANMPYFLVPLHLQCETPLEGHHIPAGLVAWDILDFVFEHKSVELDFEAPSSWYADKFIIDPYDGSRKFYTVSKSEGYKPRDPVPPGAATRKDARRRSDNIMEFSCSLWAKARARAVFKEEQPVIEAQEIGFRRNFLDDSVVKSNRNSDSKRCFIILEPLLISALPTTVVTMSFVFPAIIHRLESYLIALELCDLLRLEISPALALEAITKDSDNTEEHGADRLHFQRGMGKNYERLEFLGDCFLKMATSIALFARHPEKDENNYHVDRMMMLCNQNLLNVAINDKLRLFEYIRSEQFNRRAWYPETLTLLRGKKATSPKSHALADKTIADVSEALIGAALLSKGFDEAVHAVRLLVDSEEHPMDCFADYFQAYTKPKYQVGRATASQIDMATQIEAKHPYHFEYPRLVRSAFVHPSYPWTYEHVPNYQRLEFLGDSLLDMVCIRYLFDNHPTRDPQWLTEHKMAMVANQFLGALCVHLGFHRHLLHFNSKIQHAIGAYVDEVTLARESVEKDAVEAGKDVSQCSPDYWSYTKQPPKCLPDIVEAYIGAIFVDSSYNYSEVERFFDMHIKWFFKDMSIYDTFANKHPVTFLTNFLELNMGCRNFAICARELPDLGDGLPPTIVALVLVHGRIISSKEGQSQRYAKISAAKLAKERLGGIGLPEFKKEYGCDCRLTIEDGEELVDDTEADDVHGTAI